MIVRFGCAVGLAFFAGIVVAAGGGCSSDATSSSTTTTTTSGSGDGSNGDTSGSSGKHTSTSTTTTSSGTTVTSTSSGSNPFPTPPDTLTISATLPSKDDATIHTKSDDKIASLFNVAPKPSFDPDTDINASFLPLLDKAGAMTLDSPDREGGACGDAKFQFALNASQISVSIAGVDTLPDTACARFVDDLASGAEFTFTDVPWANSSKKTTVKIVLQ